MPRFGTIIEVRGELATIATTRRSICDGCADQSKCSIETASSANVSEEVTARNLAHAQPGDRVEFDLPGHTELKLSLLVWIVPLIGLIAGAILGANIHQWISLNRNIATLLGTILGAGLAFLVIVIIDRKASGNAALVPEILKVVSPSSCPGSCEHETSSR